MSLLLLQDIPHSRLDVAMSGIALTDRKKLGGYDFYREVLGSPKYVVAPMVDQSELVCSTNLSATVSYTDANRPGDDCLEDMVPKYVSTTYQTSYHLTQKISSARIYTYD